MLTGIMAICLTAGWVLGSVTTKAFSQSAKKLPTDEKDVNLPYLAMNGEMLPTIILKEFSVVAKINN